MINVLPKQNHLSGCVIYYDFVSGNVSRFNFLEPALPIIFNKKYANDVTGFKICGTKPAIFTNKHNLEQGFSTGPQWVCLNHAHDEMPLNPLSVPKT